MLILMSRYRRVRISGHPMMTKQGWAYEHRLVAFEAGLLTGKDDPRQVHHLNGDVHDNRLENLEVLDADEHARCHHKPVEVCINGHPATEEHRYQRPDGKGSFCKTCARDRERKAAKFADVRYTNICIRGHELTSGNTYQRPDGKGRQCLECIRIRSRQAYSDPMKRARQKVRQKLREGLRPYASVRKKNHAFVRARLEAVK